MRKREILAIVAIGLSAAQCGGRLQDDGQSDPGGGEATPDNARQACEAFATTLRDCGLLTEGDTGCDASGGDEGVEGCFFQCVSTAGCAELEMLVCQDMPNEETAQCLADCVGEDLFTCQNGDLILGEWQCDGEPDCPDGEDEDGCGADAFFQCDSGETIPRAYECDAAPDCSDGSDENDCSTEQVFTCSDGEPILGDWKCDGVEDCPDGSDESGCPPGTSFSCDDGERIPADWECDGEEDCLDGSDESGCPPGTSFSCDDGASIPADWECDGVEDCFDGSDEHESCPPIAELICSTDSSDQLF